MTTSPLAAIRFTASRGLAPARHSLREHLQARAERRQLRRELSTYTTTAEVDDLLGSLRGQDGIQAEEMRTIVLRNLEDNQLMLKWAS